MLQYRSLKFAALLALTAAIAAPRHVEAQAAPDRAVRAVVDSFFAAVAREQWDSAAALFDLQRFEPFYKQQVRNARTMLPEQRPTAEQFMAMDSTMSRAVAEWQVAQSTRYNRPAFGDMTQQFAGVRTLQAFFALTLPEAAARWLQAQDQRTQVREARARAGCPLEVLSAMLPSPTSIVLAIAVSDSTAYVVHNDDRFTNSPEYLSGTERVMVLHRSGKRWRIEPRQDLLRPSNLGMSYSAECPPKK